MPGDSMTFNNSRKPRIYLLEGRTKSPFFPVNRTFVKYAGGYRLKKTDKGLLEIQQPIGFTVQDDEHALAIRDELTSWLITDDWAPLEFDNEPGRIYQAIVQNSMDDFNRFAHLRQGTIQFVAVSAEGSTHDLSVLTTYQTFTIGGQEEAPWTSRTVFTAAASQYVLETNEGGKIILNFSFISGDVLEIDYFKRKVTLNGASLAVAVSLQTQWAPLTPGFMTIKASRATTVTYTERYS